MVAETQNIISGEQKRKGFSVGIRRLGGRYLHTTRSIAQIFVWVVFNVSSPKYVSVIFVADLIACRLTYFIIAVACRPVTPRLWSGFLVCLLLLAGWFEGFCGVQVSEALAVYVVLVPFLLVE